MPLRRIWRVSGCTLGVLSMLLLVSAGSAAASVDIRFVHALPGEEPAALNLSVDGAGASSAAVSFGKVGAPLEAEAGDAKLTVVPAGGEKGLATADEALEDGASYTAVALPKEDGEGAQLKVFRDDKPKSGEARLRAIHAGSELGEPDIRVGDRVVAEKLAFGEATDYVDVPPGTQDVSVTRAGGEGGPLATKADVPLSAGTATTAIVVGSGGEPTSVLTITDGTAAPEGAPATGFGGLANDDGAPSPLAFALLFALAAAGMGAAGWVIAGRR